MKNWINFNISQQTYKPVSVQDIVSDKAEIIHKILFDNALSIAVVDNINSEDPFFKIEEYSKILDVEDGSIIKFYKDKNKYVFIKDIPENLSIDDIFCVDLNKYRIYENIKNTKNFYDPSTVTFISKRYDKRGFKKLTIELNKYWDNSYNKEFLSNAELKQTIDYEYPFNDIIEYDYIKAKAKIENRVENKIRWIRFNEISNNDDLNIQLFF